MLPMSRIEEGYIQSTNTTEEWNDQRGIDMHAMVALSKLSRMLPEAFSGIVLHELISALPTFRKNPPSPKA
jgi:hypothetical protein